MDGERTVLLPGTVPGTVPGPGGGACLLARNFVFFSAVHVRGPFVADVAADAGCRRRAYTSVRNTCQASLLLRIFAISLLVIASATIGPARAQSVDDTLATILARAYSMLRVSAPEAEKLFEQAAQRDPSNVMVRKQLGYLYHESGWPDLAVAAFSAADS